MEGKGKPPLASSCTAHICVPFNSFIHFTFDVLGTSRGPTDRLLFMSNQIGNMHIQRDDSVPVDVVDNLTALNMQ